MKNDSLVFDFILIGILQIMDIQNCCHHCCYCHINHWPSHLPASFSPYLTASQVCSLLVLAMTAQGPPELTTDEEHSFCE